MTTIIRERSAANNDNDNVIFEVEALINSSDDHTQDDEESKQAHAAQSMEVLRVRHSDSLDIDHDMDAIESDENQDENSADKAGVILG